MSETDRRLKDHLNTNQAMRERMCLEILSVQDGYSDIRPRLPKGGPDGGRDIQGTYEGEPCFGAVGFVNDATDTDQHRNKIVAKFNDDLQSALESKGDGSPAPTSFVFFTNVGLTPGIITGLRSCAYQEGFTYCDVFDRERLRIALDSNRGYAIRFRYLDIPLNDTEQKDFFSAWADGINALIGSGLKGLDKATKRIQFLLEAQLPLDHLGAIVKLDTSIWEACRGEFFFQTSLALRVHSDGLLGLVFGGGTEEIVETLAEWEARGKTSTSNGQYGFGFSWLLAELPQYVRYVGDHPEKLEHPRNAQGEDRVDYIRTSRSSGFLEVHRRQLYFKALSEPFIHRIQPTCKLLELENCLLLFDCNRDLAEHIDEIVIIGGGYELLKLNKSQMCLEQGKYERLRVPNEGKQEADSHEWVTLRPSEMASCFTIDLMSTTPKRFDW